MTLRLIVLGLCLADAILWLLGIYMLGTQNPEANAVAIVSLIYFVTGAPALVLAIMDRSLRIALTLAVSFPVLLALVVAWSFFLSVVQHLS
jgi:hypothetical protein